MKNDLERFKKAQEQDFELALKEIKQGYKASHWIWYIFPQLRGLGFSSMSDYYGIADFAEAEDYLADPLLSSRLELISTELLKHKNLPIENIMGGIDALKLHASMTLFFWASETEEENCIYKKILDCFYKGEFHQQTMDLLNISRS